MNNEFFDALILLEKEKGITVKYLVDKISTAIGIAVKRDFGGIENVNVDINPETRKFKVAIVKTPVEEVEDEVNEITLTEALKYNKRAKIGIPMEIKLETKQFGRIAAQTAKHVIRQGIREAERENLLEQFNSKLHEVITVVVQKVDNNTGNVTVEIEGREVMLFKNDQLPNDNLVEGDRIKVYVAEVVAGDKRCSLKISRTHKDLVKRLFELEVPEVYDGTIEIKSVSREAGARTKMAVYSKDSNVDPVGSCIGAKNSRKINIINELKGEKIDIVKYSENQEEFISNALSPSSVISVNITNLEEKICTVIVPHDQLSLAIGNRGQNAKLAARLTGYKIDIRSDEQDNKSD